MSRNIGWVATGGDTFVIPVMEWFRARGHNPHRLEVLDYNTLRGLDTLWLEWANETTIQITQGLRGIHPDHRPRVIVRLHSYEALAGFHHQVAWDVVDHLVFVSEQVRNWTLTRKMIDGPRVHTIPNGLRLAPRQSYDHTNRDIVWAGDINHKKGPMLFAQVVRRLAPLGFRFHVIPRVVDPRFQAYFDHTIQHYHNVVYHQPMDRKVYRQFLRGRGWVLSTSPWESFQYAVGERTRWSNRTADNRLELERVDGGYLIVAGM